MQKAYDTLLEADQPLDSTTLLSDGELAPDASLALRFYRFLSGQTSALGSELERDLSESRAGSLAGSTPVPAKTITMPAIPREEHLQRVASSATTIKLGGRASQR